MGPTLKTGRGLLAWFGWLGLMFGVALVAGLGYHAHSEHALGLLIGLSGALVLVIPPVRQAYRVYPFRNVDESDANVPIALAKEGRIRQAALFSEFSWVDVSCFILGPALLAAGYLIEMWVEIFH